MIDLNAVSRHGTAAIAHGNPVSMRVPAVGATPAGTPFPADFAAAQGKLIPVAGGLIYDRGGTLFVSKAVLPAGVKEGTFLELFMPTPAPGAWIRYKVDNASHTENPQVTEAKIVIVPPGK